MHCDSDQNIKTPDYLVGRSLRLNHECSRAGLKNFRFHDMRHMAATRLIGAHIRYRKLAGSWVILKRIRSTATSISNVETARRAAAALDTVISITVVEGQPAEIRN